MTAFFMHRVRLVSDFVVAVQAVTSQELILDTVTAVEQNKRVGERTEHAVPGQQQRAQNIPKAPVAADCTTRVHAGLPEMIPLMSDEQAGLIQN
jgi:hypothetical protein